MFGVASVSSKAVVTSEYKGYAEVFRRFINRLNEKYEKTRKEAIEEYESTTQQMYPNDDPRINYHTEDDKEAYAILEKAIQEALEQRREAIRKFKI